MGCEELALKAAQFPQRLPLSACQLSAVLLPFSTLIHKEDALSLYWFLTSPEHVDLVQKCKSIRHEKETKRTAVAMSLSAVMEEMNAQEVKICCYGCPEKSKISPKKCFMPVCHPPPGWTTQRTKEAALGGHKVVILCSYILRNIQLCEVRLATSNHLRIIE